MGIYVRVSDRHTSGVREIASVQFVDGLNGSVFQTFYTSQSLSDRCQNEVTHVWCVV